MPSWTSSNHQGCLALVLHAHLPYVRHPEQPAYLEEDWLFEAITESYIPLVTGLMRLAEDEVPCRITLSMSPPLAEMLADDLLRSRYLSYLNLRIELAEKEVQRTRNQPQFHVLARQYLRQYAEARDLLVNTYRRSLLTALRDLQDRGLLELITCPGAHPYMPFVAREEVKRAQLAVALATHQRHFGERPRGLWLAECGYEPGLEALLCEFGFEYFILDSHGLLLGEPPPEHGVFSPVRTPSGVAAFGRDMESSWQVWNVHGGYPGDFAYREFYRDLGFDAEYEYIRPYLHADGIRRNVGIKYFRITGSGDLGDRAPYEPRVALAKAAEHADHFIRSRQEQVEQLSRKFDRPPVVVAPYDAELFGHWWYEGPQFLEWVIRKAASKQNNFRLVTPSDFLRNVEEIPFQQPAASSWGAEGYHQVWLNPETQWLYRHQHQAEDRMVELANRFPDAQGNLRRMLNQAGRELLLAQSSDWAFIISHRASSLYAVKRFRRHIDRFTQLHDQILRQSPALDCLREIEDSDNIFPDLDYRIFRSDSEGRAM